MAESKCDPTRNYYRYYDTPDGCDPLKKAMVTSRYGVTAGLLLSTADVMMYSHAVGLSNILKRYMLHCVPLGLMGATFALVANGVQHLRERDDPLNYFIGGFSCGPIAAAYLGSAHFVLLGGLALGVMGVIKKDAIDHGWQIIPSPPRHLCSVNDWRHDYTLVADPRDEYFHTCDEHSK